MAWKEVNNHSCDFFMLRRTFAGHARLASNSAVRHKRDGQEGWERDVLLRTVTPHHWALGSWILQEGKCGAGCHVCIASLTWVSLGWREEACAWNIGKGKTEFAQSMNQYHRSFLFSKLIHNLVKTCVSESIWMDGGLLIATWLED